MEKKMDVPVVEKRKLHHPPCACFEKGDESFILGRDGDFSLMAKNMMKHARKEFDKAIICEKASTYAAGRVLVALTIMCLAGKRPVDPKKKDAAEYMLGINSTLDDIIDHAKDWVDVMGRDMVDGFNRKK